MSRRLLLRVVSASFLVLSACSGQIVGDEPAKQGMPSSYSAVELGQMAVDARGCGACHTSEVGELAGASEAVAGGFGPNLTPDVDTGVGEWTDEQLMQAIRFGVDDEDATLCSVMPRAPDMSDDEARNIVAYLRSLPAVHHEVAESACDVSPTDAALHGQLVVKAQACASCHGADLSGSDQAVPGSSSYGPNLTPDSDTGLGEWTADQVVSALRTGLDDEGARLCSQMPRYDGLGVDALEGVAAYLRSLAPVHHETPETECTDVVDPAARGAQLVTQLACDTCHGVGLVGDPTGVGGKPVYAPNLTPDPDTGVGGWTDAQLVSAIRVGVDDEGAMLCDAMPRYATLSDDDAQAIVTYLRSLAPVSNEVPESTCRGDVDAGTTTPDAGTTTTPDAGTATPDAGTATPDAGTATPDAGTATPDAGTATPDAGTTTPDAGTTTPDAGTTTPDAGTTTPDAGTPTCSGSAIVISEVYGGGGNASALYDSDFVELHNRSATAVDVSGWALQYASSAGSAWSSGTGVLPAGTTIAAGAYLLVAVGGHGTTGAPLPGTPVSLSRSIDFSASSGKVALTRTSTALSGACPTSADLVDFVGYGTANCSEGSMSAPVLSSSLAAVRGSVGADLACADTDVNGADFSARAPAPHGSANVCTCF